MALSLLLCVVFLINSVFCEEFKCPERRNVGKLKVPNVLELIDKQTGYHATVEVINPTRNNLVHDFYDMENKVGFIDLEAIIQDKMNRRYYYHSTNEKIAVRENKCTRLDLTQNEKIESIKDWFEPADIVASSEMFKDFIHFGPTGLMVYAHSISDEASFIGSELIDGRTVNHWFYCSNPNGPYIDFYFDVKTSLPYRFSLYYPEWIDAEKFLQVHNESTIYKKQVDSESKYVYNFFTFKPLVISSADPIPYPLGYGCARKNTSPTHPLPDFSQIKAFTMDMEAIITYPGGSMTKSTARVMKQGDVISYEITERTQFVRYIELPPPLGLFEVDENSGQCRYRTSNYNKDVTLITSWPLNTSFNLLYYLVMKPSRDHPTTFIGDIPLGPIRVEEYRATNFSPNNMDAIIDYYYYSSDDSAKVKVPFKVVFTKDRGNEFSHSLASPDKIEVTIIDYRDDYFDLEDRFDVSGCYEKPGAFTWFQLVFSNPWMNDVNLELIRQEVQDLLLKFIPITRIGEIHAIYIDSNVYVTVKLHDRIHLIDTYSVKRGYTISSPTDIVQKLTPEDCEQLCSSTTACYDFSYCSNFDCFILAFPSSSIIDTQYNEDCNVYRRVWFGHKLSEYVEGNHLSSMLHVLQQIRNKVSEGQFLLHSAALTAEDLFIVSGPGEIGDISQEYRQGTSRPVKGEDFPLIKTGRHFNEAQFKIEKGSLTECFMACLNDEDCNTLSYCINKNKECILSGETSTTLNNKLEDKTSHADGCNIYEKSFINLFSEFPGKNLVLDAVSTVSNVLITDCAKACAQAKDFNCESFDYCSDNNDRNASICYLHVNHIETDTAHEINRTNWKFAEDGCTHFSKKSDRDYEHKVGYSLKDDVKESVVGTFNHLSLDHCASKCNSDPDCFTLEFCETIGYDSTFDSSFSSSSCRLTNLKSTSVVNQTQFFEQSKDPKRICSIFINHMKIVAKAKFKESSPFTMKSNHFNLAIGTGAAIFILSLAGGFVGFTLASRKGLI